MVATMIWKLLALRRMVLEVETGKYVPKIQVHTVTFR